MPSADIKATIETRPLQFHIRAGGAKWACTVHPDRATYERVKATRTGSSSSLSSQSSTSSTGSSRK